MAKKRSRSRPEPLPLLPGFQRVGGTRRGYIDEEGNYYSRRAYQKLIGRPLQPKYEFTMWRYNDIVSQFIAEKVKQGDYTYVETDPKTGEPLRYKRGARKGQFKEKRGLARQSAELKEIVRDLRSKDNSPDGRKAQALVKLGRRDPDWQFPVGQSPGKAY